MVQKKNLTYTLIVLLLGAIGSVIFILFGYWIGGAIGFVINDNLDFLTGFTKVMEDPFQKYFNNYTPVTMILAFILFEGVFFAFLIRKKEVNNVDEEQFAPETIELIDLNKSNTVSDQELFEGKISKSDKTEESDKKDYVLPEKLDEKVSAQGIMDSSLENEKDDTPLSFSDDIVSELLETYDLAQITAMLKIKNYIDINDAGLLKRMFKNTMSAEDITSYIEMFYE